MTEITGIATKSRIISKPKASMEGIHQKKEISPSLELKEMKQFEIEMHKALVMSQEIRHSLETALKDLSS